MKTPREWALSYLYPKGVDPGPCKRDEQLEAMFAAAVKEALEEAEKLRE